MKAFIMPAIALITTAIFIYSDKKEKNNSSETSGKIIGSGSGSGDDMHIEKINRIVDDKLKKALKTEKLKNIISKQSSELKKLNLTKDNKEIIIKKEATTKKDLTVDKKVATSKK